MRIRSRAARARPRGAANLLIAGLASATPAYAAETEALTGPTSAVQAGATSEIDSEWRLESRPYHVAGESDDASFPAESVRLIPVALNLAVAEPERSTTNVGQADPRYRSFDARVGAVKWETAGIFALLTAGNIRKVIDEPQSFRFQDEGLFGKNTADLGVDKLAHSFNTYLISEILYRRMERKSGGGLPSAVTSAVLASGLQIYGEVYDGLHKGSGFSWGDVGFNVAGAGFSVLRNTVPGLKAKLDFRIMIVPNENVYTYQGKRHFEQQHFLLALKLAGFDRLRNSPLRFLEVHVGYHAKDFTIGERLAGVEPKRLPFVGLGFNFAQLFRSPQTWVAKAARTTLQYYQIPYTSLHVDLPTGRLSP